VTFTHANVKEPYKMLLQSTTFPLDFYYFTSLLRTHLFSKFSVSQQHWILYPTKPHTRFSAPHFISRLINEPELII